MDIFFTSMGQFYNSNKYSIISKMTQQKPTVISMFLNNFSSHLVAFLVKTGRHLQQGAALVQRRSKGFPLLLQLA